MFELIMGSKAGGFGIVSITSDVIEIHVSYVTLSRSGSSVSWG